MNKITSGIRGAKADLLPDTEYGRRLKLLCEKATHRILANVFLIDLVQKGNTSIIAHLLESIANATARGVVVRLIVGGSNENVAIGTSAEAVFGRCEQLGIPCKIVARTSGRSSHKKVVIIDDTVLIGSHNWGAGAFLEQTQDSIAVYDAAMAAFFTHQYILEWQNLR